jgi:hypothetical protein
VDCERFELSAQAIITPNRSERTQYPGCGVLDHDGQEMCEMGLVRLEILRETFVHLRTAEEQIKWGLTKM